MSRRHRIWRTAAAVAVLCALLAPAVASATGIVTRFKPADFTATSALDWWLLGTGRCGSAECLPVLGTEDGGRTFSVLGSLPSSNGVNANATVAQIRFANTRDGYAYGPELWSTHNGGRSWRQLQIGFTQDLEAGGGYVYALVTDHGPEQLMRSPVGRDDWKLLPTPGVPFFSGMWIQGRTVILQGLGHALVSTDAGEHFRVGGHIPRELGCNFDATASTPVYWAICFRAVADPGGQLMRSTDGGRVWSDVAVHGILDGPITELAAASPEVAVVAAYQHLYRTVDGGATWSPVAGTPGRFYDLSLGFIDATHGVALGSAGIGSHWRIAVYYTTDAGASYHVVPIRIAAARPAAAQTSARATAASSGHAVVPSPCLQLPEQIQQSPDGRISGCLRVGPLGSGRYTISLQADLMSAEAIAKNLAFTKRQPREGPPVRLSLSPDAGPPGTVVTVRGRVSRPISPIGRTSFDRGQGDFMWDGSPQGLMLSGQEILWTSASTFVAKVTVPDAPWIEDGKPPQVLGLRSGGYPISVHCVTSTGGCAVAAPEGSAQFRLEVAHPPSWCPSARSCGKLTSTPVDAPAGAVVQISGHAPLIEFDNGGDIFNGTAQATYGRQSRGVRFTKGERDTIEVMIGGSPLEVRGSPYIWSIGRLRTLAEVSDGPLPIAGAPDDLGIVAWCGASSIELTVDGATTSLSTRAAEGPLRADGMYEAGDIAGRCADVLPLSPTKVLAAFSGWTGKDTGIIADYSLETQDAGRTWAPLPVPAGSLPAGFGGFRVSRVGVEAVYARQIRARYGPQFDATQPVVETTSDGGSRWTATSLACPSTGPCLTLGPFLQGNCAMGVSTQYVLSSPDGGHSWRQAGILDPDKLACGDVQLVNTGPHSALLVDALSSYPIQRTGDGGANWRSLGLPSPNDMVTTGVQSFGDFGPGGITLLPDGSLLLAGGGFYTGGWQLLSPGAKRWCPVAGNQNSWQRAPQASTITVIGADLWWLSYGNTPHHGPTPIHVHERPLSAVRCA